MSLNEKQVLRQGDDGGSEWERGDEVGKEEVGERETAGKKGDC